MQITAETLAGKLRVIHPEIDRYGLGLNTAFDKTKKAWKATFTKGAHTMDTYLEEKDVENCMHGEQCVYIGVQLGQFIKNYCEGGTGCKI
ncbi:MAG: hypothetical protein WCR47_03865 [Desulfoplanes sp.]